MTLPTLHIPPRYPDWWLEADAQTQESRDVTVNPTLNQLVSGAYGDAPEPQNQFSELEEMERDWQQQVTELRNQ